MLTALDWVILAGLGISAIFSIMRGFIREMASIISWVCAFVVTGKFYPFLASYLVFSDDAMTRAVIAILILFIATLMLVGWIGSGICRLLQKAGLSGFDRLLGMAFGLVRGILVAAAILALLQILFKLHILAFITDYPWWRESLFVPELQRIVEWFFKYMGTPVGGA